jgi:hypothetical protein
MPKLASCTALLAAVLLGASGVRAAEFDRTVPATPGMRLDARLFGGFIVVRAWDRDAVRVRASHFATDEIDVQPAGSEIQVRARTKAGAPHGIDLEISVPVWMPLTIAGPYVDVTASGTKAAVTVETVRGDIRLTGGSGAIQLSSIEGQVVLNGASGTARLRAVNNGIRVTGFTGTLQAQTVDGSVRLLEVDASSADVSTMSGDILWEGPLAADGRYQLVTHSGDIDVTLPAAASATVTIHALDGHVRSQFSQALRQDPDNRSVVVLGSGRPRLDLESFNGIISLRPSTSPSSAGTR